MTEPQYRRQFDNARTPYDARNALGITSVSGAAPPFLTDAPSNSHYYGRYNATWANLDEVYMRWVPYTGPPQSFLKQDLTRDGDWTMVALNDTTDRPAPQASGTEEDLLPIWTPTTASNPANYTVYNEWTINTAGWIDQYGADVLNQNTGKQHVITLAVNGVVKDTFTATPNTAQLYWHDITPLVVASGAVIRVTNSVSGSGNLYWYQQTGLFATAPVYCSLAVGSKDGAAAGTTAYGCHLLFTPGTKSPNWDVVAYGGAAAGGGGGGGGVVSLNTLVGALTVAAGTGINVASAGTTITVSAPLFGTSAQGDVPASGGGTTNFLRADGTWAAPTAASVVPKRILVVTTSTTYTAAAGTVAAIIECVGGGGGGGGVNPAPANYSLVGGGGGGGGYGRKLITGAQLTSQPITIGAAGAAGAANGAGGTGGDTTFGSPSICTGKGGFFGAASGGNCTGGMGGAASGVGDATFAGSPGQPGFWSSSPFLMGAGGGGASVFGGGAPSVVTSTNASAANGGTANGLGSGGGGGYSFNGGTSATGSAGAAGVVVITEFGT
jgi:hypothetical protein